MNPKTISYDELRAFIFDQPDNQGVDPYNGCIYKTLNSPDYVGCVLAHYGIKEGLTTGFGGIKNIRTTAFGDTELYRLESVAGKLISYIFNWHRSVTTYKDIKGLIPEWEAQNL